MGDCEHLNKIKFSWAQKILGTLTHVSYGNLMVARQRPA